MIAINDLEPTICVFEALCGCTLTLHDHMHLFYSGETSMVSVSRYSHRKTYPDECAKELREVCIAKCDVEVDAYIKKAHPRCFVKQCQRGLVEVVAPVYRNGEHAATFFAGLWRKPLDDAQMGKTQLLLPVFASGFVESAAKLSGGIKTGDVIADQIHAFISRNYNQSVSTADVANVLSLSITRTCHVVQQHCGDTFGKLLMNERIFHVKLYLRHSNYRVNEIAMMCGFNSVEHFNRSFKKYIGMAPGEYRKQCGDVV